MELLERENFLALLDEYRRDAAGGDSRVVLIAGEAGVGKTTLVETFAAQTAGDRWLWGACDGSLTPQPLAPLLDIADEIGGELATECRGGDLPRSRLFRLLKNELSASDALTVLVFEDVHWADEASLDLITFLSRRVRDCSVLILATYRDDALGREHPLRAVLGEVGVHRWARRLSLPNLSSRAVTQLAEGRDVDVDQLYTLTGGNPFYVREALASSGDQLLTSVHDAVQARVCRLSAAARSLVDWVSVCGAAASVEHLSALTDVSADLLDECVASGAMTVAGDMVRFRHELARAAVEASLPEHRRRSMNAELLRVLIDSGEKDAARLTHHAVLAADGGAVREFAPRAAVRAAHLGAHREAALQWERALEWRSGAVLEQVADWTDQLAEERGMLDEWERSADLRVEAAARWRDLGERRRLSTSLRKLAHARWRLCDGVEYERLAGEAIDVLAGEPDCVELGWALSVKASFLISVNTEDAERLARRAVALGEECGDDALISDALNNAACARWYRGEDAADELRRALEVAVDGEHEAQAGRAFSNLHSYLVSCYRWAEADEVFDEGRAFWEVEDISTYEACLKGGHVRSLERQGRWTEMLSIGRDIVARARDHLSPVNRLNPLQGVGRVLARRGDDEGAEMLEESLTLARPLSSGDWLSDSLLGGVELAWLNGDEVEARRLCAEAADLVSGLGLDAVGDVLVWAHRLGLPVASGGHLTAAHALSVSGDHLAASRAFDELALPYDAAMSLLDSGDPDAMREAVRRFEELGAGATASRARQIMRRHGVAAIPRGSRASTRDDPLGLTSRERDVLSLICEGESNAGIAQRLVISPKTVDHHVSSILSKLGVASRQEAASVALAAVST